MDIAERLSWSKSEDKIGIKWKWSTGALPKKSAMLILFVNDQIDKSFVSEIRLFLNEDFKFYQHFVGWNLDVFFLIFPSCGTWLFVKNWWIMFSLWENCAVIFLNLYKNWTKSRWNVVRKFAQINLEAYRMLLTLKWKKKLMCVNDHSTGHSKK